MTTVKRTKKSKDSNAPKRPSSAFILYMNDNRDRIKKSNPDASFGELSKIGGAEWAGVKPVVKAKYEKLAEADKARYQKALETYVPSPEDKVKRKKKDPNAPKRASSAYLFYVNAKRDKARKDHPDLKMTEITSLLAEQWKGLSDREKKPYDDMAAKDKIRYDNETKQ